MTKFPHHDIGNFIASISIMILLAYILGELSKKAGLPRIIGETLAGIILGPTLMGSFFPKYYSFFTERATLFESILSIALVFLLFTAGTEIKLSMMIKNKKSGFYTCIFGMLIPFLSGFSSAWYFPELFKLTLEGNEKFTFALFLGTALSISALPVIAKILMDSNLIKTSIGSIIITSAIFTDIIGLSLFFLILKAKDPFFNKLDLIYALLIFFIFTTFMLTLIRNGINRLFLKLSNEHFCDLLLALAICLSFLSAAFTDLIKLHICLGAFIAGLAFSQVFQWHTKVKESLHQLVMYFFAPLVFVSIGLKVNFSENFDLQIVFIILCLAFISKMSGSWFGAYFSGVSAKNALTIASGMNARGAMEIILSALALEADLISAPIFVALAIMALLSTLTSGVFMKKFIIPKAFTSPA